MGRPKAKIDWGDVGEMLKCGCDASSIAIALGISPHTLYTRSKVDNKLDFSAFSQQKRAEGDDLLRRKQFEIAMGGNIPMLIWLGKNRLGQTDKHASRCKGRTTQRSQSTHDNISTLITRFRSDEVAAGGYRIRP